MFLKDTYPRVLFLKTVPERFDVERCTHFPSMDLRVLVNELCERDNYLTVVGETIQNIGYKRNKVLFNVQEKGKQKFSNGQGVRETYPDT